MFELFFLLSLVVTILTGLLIATPLTGALVRLRANYNPRGLQLDDEGNAEPHTGPIVTSFFGMLGRVKRIEGWSGLYKGFMPTFIETVLLTIYAVLVLPDDPRYRRSRSVPASGVVDLTLYSLVLIVVSLPATVITYRSITTPYRLPWLNPVYSLRVLLTPTERRKPWVIYLTPGLFLSQFLHAILTILFLGTLRNLLIPQSAEEVHPARLAIYLVIASLSTVVLCPLEVIITKLAIQRNHAAAEYNSVAQEVEDDAVPTEEFVEYSGSEEDVIGLRHERDPYLGLVDCAKKVAQEEGWTALYRAWWYTWFVTALSTFA
ncbi:mitochondrial carrier [Panus rudis PR-1116 ss-1]|nr:mitochondrial carrier [Panus rudis PR-1116 ss-1]